MKRLWLLVGAALPAIALAQVPEYHLILQGHRFTPSQLQVPANARVKLQVENRDATPEEFDSYDLNREKVVPGHSTGTVYIGPLEPGRYAFMGEFHSDTAQGVVVAKPAQ